MTNNVTSNNDRITTPATTKLFILSLGDLISSISIESSGSSSATPPERIMISLLSLADAIWGASEVFCAFIRIGAWKFALAAGEEPDVIWALLSLPAISAGGRSAGGFLISSLTILKASCAIVRYCSVPSTPWMAKARLPSALLNWPSLARQRPKISAGSPHF